MSQKRFDYDLLSKIPPPRIILSELCRRSFWSFCQTLAPDFYIDDRHHLVTLCNTLQAFYENKLLNDDGVPYKNLMLEMPPRHGKSRTLCMFEAWILGRDPDHNRFITASFNDDLAQDFSRNVRDLISAEKNVPDDWIYHDIFPDTVVKRGDASYKKWALEGQFFSYKGCGIGAMITGKGGNWLIVDDAVKDAEMAYNEDALTKVWRWFTGTFLSRGEHAKKIVCGTPWASKDLGGQLLARQPEKWYKLSMPACTDGVMLCDGILTYDEYCNIRDLGDNVKTVFAANYDLVRVDTEGALYGAGLMTYDVLPEYDDIECFGGYADTADEGEDYLCAITGVLSKGDFYITDVLFTQDPQDTTEIDTAKMIIDSKTREMMIESNNGGRGFARNVEDLVRSKKYTCAVRWFSQSKNKIARIMTHSSQVKQHILFPDNWSKRWPEFYMSVISYQRMGKNKHDDAADALTGIVETYLERTIKFDDAVINSARRARAKRMSQF